MYKHWTPLEIAGAWLFASKISWMVIFGFCGNPLLNE
jgi:hypothetical protein